MLYIGCCESRLDPLKLGRCKVRIVGLHIEDKSILPTDELPWAVTMMPANNGSISGLGWSPTGILPGTWCILDFLDDSQQQPVILGTILGIPHTQTAAAISEATNSLVTTDDTGNLVSALGEDITGIINDVITGDNPGVTQDATEKYHVNAVTDKKSTGDTIIYNINPNGSESPIATATYDETTGLYTTTLLTPEKYTQSQYTPFLSLTPKTFTSTQEMLTYFDKNF